MSKVYQQVIFEEEAREELRKGAEILYKAVKSTMGPSGHNVIIDNGISAPLITKDGVTVAKSINLKEKLPSLGAELLKEVASKTNELAGDGTTTATVLGYGLLQQGIKMIATGRSSIELKSGMDFASGKIISWLNKYSIKVRNSEDIINVGTISANGDRKIGELLSEALSKVGENGIITIEPAKSVNTTLEVVEGMQFDSGYTSPYFVTNQEKLSCELQEPYILITNKKITQLKEIVPILELVANTNKPLLVIGDEIEGEVLHTLLVNKMKGVLFSCAVKAPSYSENRSDILQDIALVTGGTVLDSSSELALQNVTLDHLGKCKKITVTRNTTTIIGNGSEEAKELVSDRVSMLRSLLQNDISLDDLRRNNIKKRLAKLAGGVAVIKVGGSTEIEIFEKKDRVEDALNATQAAMQEGIVAGGGTALFYAASDLEKEKFESLTDDELAGVQVVINTCKMPLRTIVENTGKSPEVVMEKLNNNQPLKLYTCEEDRIFDRNYFGYDARKHDYCNLIARGVIDPVKVETRALEHACSVIGLVLTSNCVIANKEEGLE